MIGKAKRIGKNPFDPNDWYGRRLSVALRCGKSQVITLRQGDPKDQTSAMTATSTSISAQARQSADTAASTASGPMSRRPSGQTQG